MTRLVMLVWTHPGEPFKGRGAWARCRGNPQGLQRFPAKRVGWEGGCLEVASRPSYIFSRYGPCKALIFGARRLAGESGWVVGPRRFSRNGASSLVLSATELIKWLRDSASDRKVPSLIPSPLERDRGPTFLVGPFSTESPPTAGLLGRSCAGKPPSMPATETA